MNEQGLLGVNLETNDYSMKNSRRERRADRRTQLRRQNYFTLLSRAAHAWDTPESAALLPGITAQPPFST